MTAASASAQDPASFKVERPSIGLNNRTYSNERCFGEAAVQLGPFRFTAYVTMTGDVSLPTILHDDETCLAIQEAVRAAVLEEVQIRWATVERHNRTRSRVIRRCPPREKAP